MFLMFSIGSVSLNQPFSTFCVVAMNVTSVGLAIGLDDYPRRIDRTD